MTQGKHFWMRSISSTAIGVTLESATFYLLVFYNQLPMDTIIQIIINLVSIKLIYEIMLLPITYKIVSFLKRKENIDTYDYNVSFNPFTI